MKRQAACCVCQDYTFTQATRALAPHNLRPRAGDCTSRLVYRKLSKRPSRKRKVCEHVVENNFC